MAIEANRWPVFAKCAVLVRKQLVKFRFRRKQFCGTFFWTWQHSPFRLFSQTAERTAHISDSHWLLIEWLEECASSTEKLARQLPENRDKVLPLCICALVAFARSGCWRFCLIVTFYLLIQSCYWLLVILLNHNGMLTRAIFLRPVLEFRAHWALCVNVIMTSINVCVAYINFSFVFGNAYF